MSEIKNYPKWLYHKTDGAKLIQNEDEHKELGKDWKESPAEFEAKTSSKVVTREEEQALSEEVKEEKKKSKK